MWDTITGSCLRCFIGHTEAVTKAAFFNEKVIISVSEDQTLKFWHMDTGECHETKSSGKKVDNTAWINDVKILKDGCVATVGVSGKVHVWKGFA